MYSWQQECLDTPGVLEGHRNLVVIAPTSAGKSRVADALISKRMQTEPHKKVLVVLPYVALCSVRAREV